MRTPERRPSDHGGDGGYVHRCRECLIAFSLLAINGIGEFPDGSTVDGDICEECNEDTDLHE